jgi:hypothetical protein
LSLPERLVEQSSLTRRQLESLTGYIHVALGEITLREAASLVSKGRTKGTPAEPLTTGSYYRTVAQARKNVKQALTTVIIALWLGVIKVEDVRRLFELVGGEARELTDEEVERMVQVLEALLRRMLV